jgi:hypothetical protein
MPVFLALVAYSIFSVLIQSSRITPAIANLNLFDERIIAESIRQREIALLLPPVRVFREWQSYHSVEALKRHPHNRTFIVGGYSCPRQAGNIFHEYLSALLQVVATNRTFLWEHRRNEYWESLGENSEEACDRILQRAPWIPSYKEWKRTLQLDPPFLMQHDYIRSTCPEMWQRLDRGERVADDLSEYQVIQPSERMWGLYKKTEVWEGLLLLTNNYTAKYLSQFYGMDFLHDKRVHALYSQGVSFLYGMLFRESFGFTDEFIGTVSENWYQQSAGNSTAVVSRPWHWKAQHTDPSVYTIGLHSRHVLSTHNGSNVQNEIKCLNFIMGTENDDKVPCTVYIMSDRPKTNENLRTYLL